MQRNIVKLFIVSLLTQAGLVGCTHSQEPDTTAVASQRLTPRKVFFENPSRALPQISPDGKWLAYLAEKDGVMNVWVAPVSDLTQAKVVTSDKARGIRMFMWDFRSRFVIYPQDEGGNENFHLFASDVIAGTTRDLTPYPGVRAQINRISPLHPDEIVVGLNDRDSKIHDLYRIKLASGERTLLMRNDEGFSDYITDLHYKVRIAEKSLPDGGKQILTLGPNGKWTGILQVPLEDALTTDALDLDKSGKVLYSFSSVGRDTSALYSFDLGSKKSQLIAENPKADVSRVMIHPATQQIQAVGFEYERTEWTILDPSIVSDWETLSKVNPGELSIVSRTLDDQTWIVAFSVSDGPTRFYRYKRQTKVADFLFTNRPQLEGLKLAELRPVTLTSRDGLKLVSYLTVPLATDKDSNGRPDQALPLVLLVHGGPWARDSWGFNPTHQWLASRGYAVLSVNYRGSTGFGKKFINAGNFEWAGRMHNDLLDAVDWAVREKIADPSKVAIYGGSYGGYATLVGLTFTPDRFACGVDIVGPSNLETLLNSLPPYWQPVIEQFTKRVGDHRTEAGRKLLRDRSPLHRAGAITKPLLIGQGANDPRVKQAEADQIVKAMQDKRIPVTYVLYPDEGHGFARPQNRLSFSSVAESFLGSCLGGAVQPFGDDLTGSSLQVPAGAEYVPGLELELGKLK